MIEIKVVRNVILNNIDIQDQPSRCIVLPPGVAKISRFEKFKDFTNLTQIFQIRLLSVLVEIKYLQLTSPG